MLQCQGVMLGRRAVSDIADCALNVGKCGSCNQKQSPDVNPRVQVQMEVAHGSQKREEPDGSEVTAVPASNNLPEPKVQAPSLLHLQQSALRTASPPYKGSCGGLTGFFGKDEKPGLGPSDSKQ